MKIFLATFFDDPNQGDVLTNKEHWSRLISFHFIHAGNNERSIPHYIKTGKFKKHEDLPRKRRSRK